MSGWKQRVEDLLYESESVEEVFDIDSSRVVVTSHRVLAFTPEMDGQNFTQVERPNVTGVATGAQGKTALAGRSIRWGIYGLLLVFAGLLFDFERYVGGLSFDSEAAGETGAGGIVGIAQSMLNVMAQLDELMQVVGALLILVAVAMFAVYWLLRVPTLVIRVAGDVDDIHLYRPEDAESLITRMEAAILTDASQPAEDGTLSGVVPDDIL